MSDDASENQHSSTSGIHDYRITEKALLLSGGGFLSKILGFFRDLAISILFPREITDAWSLAFRIPHFCRRFFGEGVFSGALTPLLGARAEAKDSEVVWNHTLRGLLLLVSFVWAFCVGGVVWWAADLFEVLSFSGADIRTQGPLVVDLFISMAIYLWALVPIAFLSALALYQRRFYLVALTPVLFNFLILFFLFSSGSITLRIGWSLSIAGLLQLCLLLPLLRHHQGEVVIVTKKSVLLEFSKRFISATASLGFAPLLGLAGAYFATHLPTGTLSYFFWAERLLEFPLTLTASSLSLVALPLLVRGGDREELVQRQLRNYFLASLKWTIPSALGLVLGANMIVTVLFDWGQFSISERAMLTKTVMYNGGLFFFISLSRSLLSLGIAKSISGAGTWAWMHLLVLILGGAGLQRSSVWSLEALLIWMLAVTASYFSVLLWIVRRILWPILNKEWWQSLFLQSRRQVLLLLYLLGAMVVIPEPSKVMSAIILLGAAAIAFEIKKEKP